MDILLDEQLNWRLARAFSTTHHVRSVGGMGWSGLRNGTLLRQAADLFDVLITMDQHMRYQQHIPRYDLTIILISAQSNRLEDTTPLVPSIEHLLASGVFPGRLYEITHQPE